jgi:NitT/TauT family transport system ATP-binding protein
MASVQLHGVGKSFGAHVAMRDIDLEVPSGSFLTLLGPSGCGKTTTLRSIAGLLMPDRGTIRIDGEDVTRLPPHQRDLAMVFQSHALFPHMTVLDNVAFGLRMRGVDRRSRSSKAQQALELVGLGAMAGRYPHQLSGGQQQRVAIARALVVDPRVLLLDEPFGALDAFTREELWCILRDLWTEQRFNVILVTHDLRESVFLADTVYVMSKSPGRFVVQRSIDLPRPRDLELTYTKEFTDIVHELRSHIGAIRQTPRSTADRELV